MIASRLAESVLFLETTCRTDADREYANAIHRVIEEHSLMREALESIRYQSDPGMVSSLAAAALQNTTGGVAINTERALRDTLSRLVEMLPTDEQIHELMVAKSLIRKVLEHSR
ncbi:MAG: hypothetical protein RQ867_06475 [Mariprofundaceae bacterium]|nr:hypothetical protein [Mariprofundaceae bacterium]